jgi:hypothetical protein
MKLNSLKCHSNCEFPFISFNIDTHFEPQDHSISLRRPSIAILPNRWDLWRVTFDGYHMLCQMRKRARDSICPGDYCECECSKSSAIEHCMTLSPSTSLGFACVRIMNSSGYHEMKSSRERPTRNSIEKIHAHDRLESARVPSDQDYRKGRKFNAGYYIAQILKSLSHWCSFEAAGNERKLLVHADSARPHTTKLSTQYLSESRMKSAPHPPYSIFP